MASSQGRNRRFLRPFMGNHANYDLLISLAVIGRAIKRRSEYAAARSRTTLPPKSGGAASGIPLTGCEKFPDREHKRPPPLLRPKRGASPGPRHLSFPVLTEIFLARLRGVHRCLRHRSDDVAPENAFPCCGSQRVIEGGGKWCLEDENCSNSNLFRTYLFN